MPTRRLTLIALAAVAVLSLAPRGPAAAGEATVSVETAASRHVEQVIDEAIALIARGDLTPLQRRAALDGLLRRSLDIPLVGRVVLGKSWRRASRDQQRRYLELFDAYLLSAVAKGVETYYSGETLTLTGATPKGKDVMVRSLVNRDSGPPVEAVWRVRVKNDTPKIIDVKVEGISLALTTRQEFAAVVQRQGLDGLLLALEVKTQPALAEAD